MAKCADGMLGLLVELEIDDQNEIKVSALKGKG